MNKIKRLGFSGILALSFFGIHGQQINPMTEAVLQNYSEILSENPKDYLTLYDRASLFYNMGNYNSALSDIDMALEYTPDKDVDYKVAEYSLKSDIQTTLKQYQEAIKTVKASLSLQPGSQSELYKLGNLYIMTNEPQEALKTFQQLQRESPRSQEAFYGMAKANALMGNKEEATKLLNEVENLGKQSFVTYCRIGDLYSDMNDIRNATQNYIVAFSMTDNSSRPLESLKILAGKNPQLVIEEVSKMINSNSENYSLNFVKAILAYDNGLYADSEKACKELIDKLDEESPGVYRMLAISQLAQNNMDEAKANILKAESLSPDNYNVLRDKAEILMTQAPSQANEAARKAILVSKQDPEALLTGAKTAIMAGEYQEALGNLNNLILSNPSNGEALLLRGYLNTEYLNDAKAGVSDYTRAGNIVQDGSVGELVFAALGKAKSGKKLDSDALITEAINKGADNKDALYLIAVYYAQTGNLEKSKEYADKAMLKGYSNLYNISTNKEPLLNLAPIHHLFK